MAEGAWVPAFASLWTSPKTAKLAKTMHCSTDVAGAKFLRLMSWMLDHAPSGDLGPADLATVARAVGLATEKTRDSYAAARGQAFVQALVSARFATADERRHVVGWTEGPGRLVARREADRMRKDHSRAGHEGAPVSGCPSCRRGPDTRNRSNGGHSAGSPLDSGAVSAGQEGPVRRTSARTEQNRTEQNSTPLPTRPTDSEVRRAPAEQVGELVAAGQVTPEWGQALVVLSERMTRPNWETWWRRSRLEVSDGAAVVRVPNAFTQDWIRSKYVGVLRQVLEECGLVRPVVAVLVEGEQLEPDVVDEEAEGGEE